MKTVILRSEKGDQAAVELSEHNVAYGESVTGSPVTDNQVIEIGEEAFAILCGVSERTGRSMSDLLNEAWEAHEIARAVKPAWTHSHKTTRRYRRRP